MKNTDIKRMLNQMIQEMAPQKEPVQITTGFPEQPVQDRLMPQPVQDSCASVQPAPSACTIEQAGGTACTKSAILLDSVFR